MRWSKMIRWKEAAVTSRTPVIESNPAPPFSRCGARRSGSGSGSPGGGSSSRTYDAFGVFRTALPQETVVFQSSSPNEVRVSPNASVGFVRSVVPTEEAPIFLANLV
jgi:hypothetical protein